MNVGTVRILYEDDHLIAVDKPAGVIVHGDGTGSCTLTENVRDLVERRGGFPEQIAGVQALQRLDRETTGIVLFSLRKETQAAFDRIIAERAIEKRYLAIASGRIRTPREITAPIGRDRHDSRRMRVSRTGKSARTVITPLDCAPADQRAPERTLLEVDLHTGRKHQIRVHMAHIGHPLLGDRLYGGPGAFQLMLHAAELAFTHPLTGERVRITAPYPKRFEALFDRRG